MPRSHSLCRSLLGAKNLRLRAVLSAVGRRTVHFLFCVVATSGLALSIVAPPAWAQSWAGMQVGFYASTPILLTDGSVMVQAVNWSGSVGSSTLIGTGTWYLLKPDQNGNYANGAWTQLPSMPLGYAPIYYASAVLPDGHVLIEGGEYNSNQGQVETNQGAIFDPVAETWTSVSPPSGWPNIGDAQSVVLANGTLMIGNCCNSQQALFNESSLTWTLTGTGKQDANSEEGWVLLPNGNVLTVDMKYGGGTYSEMYNPATGSWSPAGQIPVSLENPNCTETGPMLLRPDGTVFAISGFGTGQTAVYNSSTGVWSAGPQVGGGLGADDAPAALLPDGNAFFQVSYGFGQCYGHPSGFYEFDGSGLIQDATPPNASQDSSFQGRMLVLPTGQVLFTDYSSDVEIFTPAGSYNSAWRPNINSSPSAVEVGGADYTVSGTQFNGLSQGAMYGDDAQMAENFPLVRIANNATGHVFYCRAHGFSTMAVATGSATVSANVDVPPGIEQGASALEVVANGIASAAVPITVNPAGPGQQYVTVSPTTLNFRSSDGSKVTETATLTNNGPGTLIINSAWVTGDYFSLSSLGCGSSLGQGRSCYAQVTFDPGGPYCIYGGASGQLSFSDSGTTGEQDASLSGTTTRCLQIRSKGLRGSGQTSGYKPSRAVITSLMLPSLVGLGSGHQTRGTENVVAWAFSAAPGGEVPPVRLQVMSKKHPAASRAPQRNADGPRHRVSRKVAITAAIVAAAAGALVAVAIQPRTCTTTGGRVLLVNGKCPYH